MSAYLLAPITHVSLPTYVYHLHLLLALAYLLAPITHISLPTYVVHLRQLTCSYHLSSTSLLGIATQCCEHMLILDIKENAKY
jgi:hypothetical protein